MGNLYGYLILAIFAFVFIGISVFVSKKFPVEGVDDFVAAGRGIPASLVAASVMVSWVWTTTIMGAAEAGMSFGVSGGLSYAWGNSIPFFVLIPLVLHLRNKMPKCTTFTEFVEQRYGRTVSKIFFVFGIGVIIYVMIAQGVGIGIVFNSMFGIPYEIGAAIPLAIVTVYISKAGLRGSIFNDVIQFFIISIIMLISIPLILRTLGMENIYNGLVDVVTNPDNINYNPEALSFASSGGFRYGLTAVVVAMGQVLLDQGYYSKAIATASSKSLLKAYIIGTVVAWMPIPILCGGVFGGSVISLGVGEGAGLSVASEAAPYIMKLVYGGGLGSVMFVLMVFMAGMTTGGGCLSGAQALFTADFYKKYVNKTATEEQQMNFGRKIRLRRQRARDRGGHPAQGQVPADDGHLQRHPLCGPHQFPHRWHVLQEDLSHGGRHLHLLRPGLRPHRLLRDPEQRHQLVRRQRPRPAGPRRDRDHRLPLQQV